jgi:TetR/AcrR family transcriptional regulator, copper-responsive repressor
MDSKMVKSGARRGRPRAFDRDEALDRAMGLFWDRGYEGTSLDDLTAAMGISTSSLYATFGDKACLFEAAIDRYLEGVGGYFLPLLSGERDVRKAFEQLLKRVAREATRPGQPVGCMLSLALTHSSPAAEAIRISLAKRRNVSRAILKARIEQAIAEGDLTPDTDAAALARFFMTVIQGMSVQARDGASRKDLDAAAGLALHAIQMPGR